MMPSLATRVPQYCPSFQRHGETWGHQYAGRCPFAALLFPRCDQKPLKKAPPELHKQEMT